MKVSEAMVKNPITVRPNVFVYEAARSMRDKKIGSVIIVDDGDVLGVVTERDLVRRVLADNRDPKKVRISEVMSSPVVSISPNEDILDAAYLMKKKGIRRLIVMEGKKLIGIITSDDMTRNMKRAMDEYTTITMHLSRHI